MQDYIDYTLRHSNIIICRCSFYAKTFFRWRLATDNGTTVQYATFIERVFFQ